MTRSVHLLLQKKSSRWLNLTATLWQLIVQHANRVVDEEGLSSFLDVLGWRIHDQISDEELSALFHDWMSPSVASNIANLSTRKDGSGTDASKLDINSFRQLLVDRKCSDPDLDLIIGICVLEMNKILLDSPISYSYSRKSGGVRSEAPVLELCSSRWIDLSEELFFLLDTKAHGSLRFDEAFFLASCLATGLKGWTDVGDAQTDMLASVLSAIALQMMEETGAKPLLTYTSLLLTHGNIQQQQSPSAKLSQSERKRQVPSYARGKGKSDIATNDEQDHTMKLKQKDSDSRSGRGTGSLPHVHLISATISLSMFEAYLLRKAVNTVALHELVDHVKSSVKDFWEVVNVMAEAGQPSSFKEVLDSSLASGESINSLGTPQLWEWAVYRASGFRSSTRSWSAEEEEQQQQQLPAGGASLDSGNINITEAPPPPAIVLFLLSDGEALVSGCLRATETPITSQSIASLRKGLLLQSSPRKNRAATTISESLDSAAGGGGVSVQPDPREELMLSAEYLWVAYHLWGSAPLPYTFEKLQELKHSLAAEDSDSRSAVPDTARDPVYLLIIAVLLEYKYLQKQLVAVLLALAIAKFKSEQAATAAAAANAAAAASPAATAAVAAVRVPGEVSSILSLACAILLPDAENMFTELGLNNNDSNNNEQLLLQQQQQLRYPPPPPDSDQQQQYPPRIMSEAPTSPPIDSMLLQRVLDDRARLSISPNTQHIALQRHSRNNNNSRSNNNTAGIDMGGRPPPPPSRNIIAAGEFRDDGRFIDDEIYDDEEDDDDDDEEDLSGAAEGVSHDLDGSRGSAISSPPMSPPPYPPPPLSETTSPAPAFLENYKPRTRNAVSSYHSPDQYQQHHHQQQQQILESRQRTPAAAAANVLPVKVWSAEEFLKLRSPPNALSSAPLDAASSDDDERDGSPMRMTVNGVDGAPSKERPAGLTSDRVLGNPRNSFSTISTTLSVNIPDTDFFAAAAATAAATAAAGGAASWQGSPLNRLPQTSGAASQEEKAEAPEAAPPSSEPSPKPSESTLTLSQDTVNSRRGTRADHIDPRPTSSSSLLSRKINTSTNARPRRRQDELLQLLLESQAPEEQQRFIEELRKLQEGASLSSKGMAGGDLSAAVSPLKIPTKGFTSSGMSKRAGSSSHRHADPPPLLPPHPPPPPADSIDPSWSSEFVQVARIREGSQNANSNGSSSKPPAIAPNSVAELLEQGRSAGVYATILRETLRQMSREHASVQLKTLERLIELEDYGEIDAAAGHTSSPAPQSTFDTQETDFRSPLPRSQQQQLPPSRSSAGGGAMGLRRGERRGNASDQLHIVVPVQQGFSGGAGGLKAMSSSTSSEASSYPGYCRVHPSHPRPEYEQPQYEQPAMVTSDTRATRRSRAAPGTQQQQQQQQQQEVGNQEDDPRYRMALRDDAARLSAERRFYSRPAAVPDRFDEHGQQFVDRGPQYVDRMDGGGGYNGLFIRTQATQSSRRPEAPSPTRSYNYAQPTRSSAAGQRQTVLSARSGSQRVVPGQDPSIKRVRKVFGHPL